MARSTGRNTRSPGAVPSARAPKTVGDVATERAHRDGQQRWRATAPGRCSATTSEALREDQDGDEVADGERPPARGRPSCRRQPRRSFVHRPFVGTDDAVAPRDVGDAERRRTRAARSRARGRPWNPPEGEMAGRCPVYAWQFGAHKVLDAFLARRPRILTRSAVGAVTSPFSMGLDASFARDAPFLTAG